MATGPRRLKERYVRALVAYRYKYLLPAYSFRTSICLAIRQRWNQTEARHKAFDGSRLIHIRQARLFCAGHSFPSSIQLSMNDGEANCVG